MKGSKKPQTAGISRRDLIKGATIGAAGVAAAGMLPSYAAGRVAGAPPAWSSDVPGRWDRTVEVLILGVGIAGACAAVEAHDLGAEVLAIEKSSQVRGACSWSGGSLCGAGTRHQKRNGIFDDVEVMVQDIMRCGDELGDPEIIRAFAAISGETIDWLEDLGCQLLPGNRASPGIHSIPRNHNVAPEGNGLGWMLGLETAIKKREIEVQFDTTATKLYRSAGGRVLGAQVKTKDGRDLNYRATKGVLLSTGGIGNSADKWKQYSPAMKEVVEKARKVRGVYPPTANGDGLPMASDVGVYLYPQQATYGGGAVELSPGGPATASLFPHRWCGAGAIGLNANGVRFWDETSFQDFYVTKKFKTQPGMWQIIVFDDLMRQSKDGQTYAQPVIDKVLASGHSTVQRADTIEALAEKFGIPAHAATKTVDEWNRLVVAGGPDKLTGRSVMGSKLEKPPFWGVEVIVSFGTSKGGGRINPRAQAVDHYGKAIPGLYCAGEIAYFQVHGSARVHVSGGCNGTGANFGRIAARNLVKEEVHAS